jgi:hypothetical protein
MKMKLSRRILPLLGALYSLALPVTSQEISTAVETDFSYGFKLLYNVNAQQTNATTALSTLRDAILERLDEVVQKAAADIQIQSLISEATGTFVNPL